jgi:hypothetical protein
VILCKTCFFINRKGSAGDQHKEYGWLAVSVSGIWEEVTHAVIEDAYNPNNESISAKYGKEFENKLDWKSPPESIKPLLIKYSFRDRGKIVHSNNAIIWSPNRICKANTCRNISVEQRSLKNLRSIAESASSVRSYFYHAGVALFHNSHDPEIKTDKLVGGDIPISNMVAGEDVGIDYWEIDGAAFINDTRFKTSK